MPSFNQSLPQELYVEAVELAKELGITRGTFVKQAVVEYCIRVRAALGATAEAAAEFDPPACEGCGKLVASTVPMQVWPQGDGPYCSLRCAGKGDPDRVPHVTTLLLHGDKMVTPFGTEAVYIGAGEFGRRHTVTCHWCGLPIPAEAPRAHNSKARKYYCTDCTTPVDIESLLQLPAREDDPGRIVELLKRKEGEGL